MLGKTKTISITSGKGGVGKTSLMANVAFNLAQKGNRVLMLDGDLGMANVDIFYGVKPEGTLLDVLNGAKTIHQILTPITPNLSLLSGGTGLVELNRLNNFQRRAIIDGVSELNYKYDYLLIDTAPGISDNVLYLNAAAQQSVVVITPDPTSLADSYALIKILNQEYRETKFTIVCNQVRDQAEGLALYNRFQDVVSRFLSIGLDYMGSLPYDPLFKRSTQNQRLILRHEPQSESAEILRQMTLKLERSLMNSTPKSGMQFFWEQVVGVA